MSYYTFHHIRQTYHALAFYWFPLKKKQLRGTQFSSDNAVTESSKRLEYRRCRKDGISALKFAEIMYKNKLVTVALLLYYVSLYIRPKTF